MRQSWGLSRHLSAALPTDVGRQTARYLRTLHPANTAKSVARDTGMSLAAVEKLLERESPPNAVNLLRLIAAYGPAFLSSVMPGKYGWLSAAARAEEAARLEREIAEREARLAELRR